MGRELDVVTLTGEEYDDLMECKEMVTSLLAQLSAAKDRIAELTAVALKGPEKALHRHGWQDLPEVAAKQSAALKLAKERDEYKSGFEAAASKYRNLKLQMQEVINVC